MLFGRHSLKFICTLLGGMVLLYANQLNAQDFNDIVDVSYIPKQKGVSLKYSKAKENDRFIFEFAENNTVPYEIKSDDKSTTIVFYGIFDIETKNIKDFDLYKGITQKKLSNRSIEITFPLPLSSSFEHLNSIILDLNIDAAKKNRYKRR